MIDGNALKAFVLALAAQNYPGALAAAWQFASELTPQDLRNLEDDAKKAWAVASTIAQFIVVHGGKPPEWPALNRTDPEWPNPMPQPPPGPETGTGP